MSPRIMLTIMNNFTTLTDEELKALKARIEELEEGFEKIVKHYEKLELSKTVANPIPLMIAMRALK